MAGQLQPAIDDWYSVLGVSETAEQSAIKAAWRQSCLAHHPDKRLAELAAAESAGRFLLATRAYSVLRDPDTRRVYDAALALSRRGQDHPVQEELTVAELLDNRVDDVDGDNTRLMDRPVCYWDCRCGDQVAISAAHLLSRLPLVQCHTCSLCLRIVYDESEARTRDLLARLTKEADWTSELDNNG